jgi:hypothetical protein
MADGRLCDVRNRGQRPAGTGHEGEPDPYVETEWTEEFEKLGVGEGFWAGIGDFISNVLGNSDYTKFFIQKAQDWFGGTLNNTQADLPVIVNPTGTGFTLGSQTIAAAAAAGGSGGGELVAYAQEQITSANNGTAYKFTASATVEYDPDSIISTTGNGRITFAEDGYYKIDVNVHGAPAAATAFGDRLSLSIDAGTTNWGHVGYSTAAMVGVPNPRGWSDGTGVSWGADVTSGDYCIVSYRVNVAAAGASTSFFDLSVAVYKFGDPLG